MIKQIYKLYRLIYANIILTIKIEVSQVRNHPKDSDYSDCNFFLSETNKR
jgi:hypothetical protein